MEHHSIKRGPSRLLVRYLPLLLQAAPLGPILDLAGGEGRNGLYLAGKGFVVIVCDFSAEALEAVRRKARQRRVTIDTLQVDLEREGEDPVSEDRFGAIVVFRYLHRPIIESIRKGLKEGGVLIYETFTMHQTRFGKPSNPDFLLKPGELKGWFSDWEILHSFEGIKRNPNRAVAQLVCRKPSK